MAIFNSYVKLPEGNRWIFTHPRCHRCHRCHPSLDRLLAESLGSAHPRATRRPRCRRGHQWALETTRTTRMEWIRGHHQVFYGYFIWIYIYIYNIYIHTYIYIYIWIIYGILWIHMGVVQNLFSRTALNRSANRVATAVPQWAIAEGFVLRWSDHIHKI